MPDMLWANLLHLSYNMWGDWDRPGTAFTDVIPEPGSIASLAAIGAGLLARRRGRR